MDRIKVATIIAIPACLGATLALGAALGFKAPWPERSDYVQLAGDVYCGRVVSARDERASLEVQADKYRLRRPQPLPVPARIRKRVKELNKNIKYFQSRTKRPC